MSEIRWKEGQQEYDREEIEYMLEAQRAMIYNDVKYLLIEQAERGGLKGQFTENGIEIIDLIGNCRKVKL